MSMRMKKFWIGHGPSLVRNNEPLEGDEMSIYEEVKLERDRQDGKWGGPEHDDQHSTADFCRYIQNYTAWADQMADMGSPEKARRRLLQVAALATAAVESIDRKRAR